MPGVHVAHFRRMCLTARNRLRHPKSPVMPRTSPTRFDAWSSRGGRLERTQGEHPHVLGLRVTARGRSPATLLLSPCYPPSEHANSTPSRRGRSGLWRRRAVRAPVGDAAAPSRRATRSKDAGRRAGRSSSPAGSCLSAMGGAAARGTCAACAARARPWRRASAARDGPAPQLCTAPPRPADASRSAPTTGGEVELAMLCDAQQGTPPAPAERCRARVHPPSAAEARAAGGLCRERWRVPWGSTRTCSAGASSGWMAVYAPSKKGCSGFQIFTGGLGLSLSMSIVL